MRLSLFLLPVFVAGCASSWRADLDSLRKDLDPVLDAHRELEPGPVTDAAPAVDEALAGRVGVEDVVRIALARNPEIGELAARAQAMVEDVGRAGALDDPMLTFRADRVPLRNPTAFNRDAGNSAALEMRFPFPGVLELKAESAGRQAEAMIQMLREREIEITAMATKAWVMWANMTRQLEIHTEHVAILVEFEKISDSRFRTGKVSQQDVLKAQVELVLLQNSVVEDRRSIDTARAELNRLMNRRVDAPLGVPAEPAPNREEFDQAALLALADEVRPELLAAERRVRAAAAAADAAGREATWPELLVGLEYMQMPMEDDAWGGMVGFSLPWITGKRSAEARRMTEEQRAERAALAAARSRVQFEVREACIRVESARKSLALFEGELLPKSRQSVDVSRASYEKEKSSFLDLLDAERSLRDIRLAWVQTQTAYATAVADLERAVGGDIRRNK